MTDETKLEAKLRMGAARQMGVVSNDARLRYLSGDFEGIVFASRDGHLRYSAGKDPKNFANDGTISHAKVTSYRPSDGYRATVSRYGKNEITEREDRLASISQSEVFDTATEARDWLREQGVNIDDKRTETIEDYRHPDECDSVTIDLHDGGTSFTCYVIGERDGKWVLSRPQNPTTEAYELTVGEIPTRLVPILGESPVIDPWSPDHDPTKEYEVRKFWRHSIDN